MILEARVTVLSIEGIKGCGVHIFQFYFTAAQESVVVFYLYFQIDICTLSCSLIAVILSRYFLNYTVQSLISANTGQIYKADVTQISLYSFMDSAVE